MAFLKKFYQQISEKKCFSALAVGKSVTTGERDNRLSWISAANRACACAARKNLIGALSGKAMKRKVAVLVMVSLFSIGCYGQSASATNVFGGRLLKSVTAYAGYNGSEEQDEEWVFTYNEAGQCVKIVNSSPNLSYYTCTYTFDYAPGTINGEAYHILLTIEEKYVGSPYPDDEDETYKCYLRLGENNFVEFCHEEASWYDDGEANTWSFSYNSDNQLLKVTRTDEDAPEVQLATYVDGDITKVSHGEYDLEIAYTSSKITNPIENTDKIMFVDDGSGFDLDELSVAYFAGLFGKPTKHLPIACSDGEYQSTCTWGFSADGKQTIATWNSGEDYEKEVFVWSESSAGISTPGVNANEAKTIYNLNGFKLDRPQRGINIINGKKIVRK